MFAVRSASHHFPQPRLQGPAVAVRGGFSEILKALKAGEEGGVVHQDLLDFIQGREVSEGFMVRQGNILDPARSLMTKVVVETRWFGRKA